MKVGDLVKHTVFKELQVGIIIEVFRNATAKVLWPSLDHAPVVDLFLVEKINEDR